MDGGQSSSLVVDRGRSWSRAAMVGRVDGRGMVVTKQGVGLGWRWAVRSAQYALGSCLSSELCWAEEVWSF